MIPGQLALLGVPLVLQDLVVLMERLVLPDRLDLLVGLLAPRVIRVIRV